MTRSLVSLVLILGLTATAHAQEGAALAAPVAEEAAVPDVEVYLQLNSGVILRERAQSVDAWFSHRSALGLTFGGMFRLGAVFLMPMFREALSAETPPSPGMFGSGVSSSSTASWYLGGLELALRTSFGLGVLHAGASAVAGGGPQPVLSTEPYLMIDQRWVVAGIFTGFLAAGVRLTENTDVLIRVDLGARVRELGPTDFLSTFSVGFDWH